MRQTPVPVRVKMVKPDGLVSLNNLAYLTDFLLGLAERERFRLSEEVGEQDTMVLRVGNRAVGSSQGEEVGGDELRALVDKLVE